MSNVLSDEETKELLEDIFFKIESTSIIDTKKLVEMNNTLNWILTLTTFLFIYFSTNRITFKIPNNLSIITCKILFVISIIVLIIHKILLISYEDFKSVYLSNLRTHYIDLKYNIEPIKSKFNFNKPVNIASFNNSFINGDFLYNTGREISINEFKKINKKIAKYARGLKFTYYIGLGTFILNFSLIIISLFRLF